MTMQLKYECIISLKKRQSYFGCRKINIDSDCLNRNGSGKCSKLIIIYSGNDPNKPDPQNAS